MHEKKRILVTGANGFVGQNLVAALVDAGAKVSCLVRPNSVIPSRPTPLAAAFASIDILCVDELRNKSAAIEAAGPFDMVYHLAAYGVNPRDRDPLEMIESNVLLPTVIAQAAARWGAAWVMSGSCSEYADPTTTMPLQEHASLQFERTYGASKAAGTLAALATSKEAGGTGAVCRLFGTFGCGENEHRLFPSLCRNLSTGLPVALSSGTQIRDFLWVEDVVNALMKTGELLLQKRISNHSIMNVCSGHGHSVREFAEMTCDAIGANRRLLRFGAIDARADDIPVLVGDPSVFKRETGWNPRGSLDTVLTMAVEKNLQEQ